MLELFYLGSAIARICPKPLSEWPLIDKLLSSRGILELVYLDIAIAKTPSQSSVRMTARR
jgi:hypothetical protein